MHFCKVVPDHLCNDEDYCLIMHADGAGTKSSLAYMYWKKQEICQYGKLLRMALVMILLMIFSALGLLKILCCHLQLVEIKI